MVKCVLLDRGTALLVLAIAGLDVVGSFGVTSATTGGDGTVETRIYRGTREVRHTIDVATNRSGDEDYHGTFDVEASRTSKRAGNTVVETETRIFSVRTGGYRFDAAMREIIVRDEHVGVEESFEQNPDGSGHSNSSAAGFSHVDLQFAPAAPLPEDGTYAIHVTSSSTGREIGPPYPVATAAHTVPDHIGSA